MRLIYQNMRPSSVLYARAHGAYDSSTRRAWKTMGAWLDRHKARSRMRVSYGLFHDNPTVTAPELLRYDACIPLLPDLDFDETDGISRRYLAGGGYAVHTHVGSHEETGQIFSIMRRKVVAERGLTVDFHRPFMRIYLTDPTITAGVLCRTSICVPVLPISFPIAGNDSAPSIEVDATPACA